MRSGFMSISACQEIHVQSPTLPYLQSFESTSPANISPASYFSVAFVEQAAKRGRSGAREKANSCPVIPRAIDCLLLAVSHVHSTGLF